MAESAASSVPPDGFGPNELIPFGKYLLLDQVSEGASASVFRAKAVGETFDRLVAVKFGCERVVGRNRAWSQKCGSGNDEACHQDGEKYSRHVHLPRYSERIWRNIGPHRHPLQFSKRVQVGLEASKM